MFLDSCKKNNSLGFVLLVDFTDSYSIRTWLWRPRGRFWSKETLVQGVPEIMEKLYVYFLNEVLLDEVHRSLG